MRYSLIPFRIASANNVDTFNDLLSQSMANIIMFIPVGVLLPFTRKKHIIIWGGTLSVLMETMQLLSRRGVFEIDDIIYNSFGTVVGYLLFRFIKREFYNYN